MSTPNDTSGSSEHTPLLPNKPAAPVQQRSLAAMPPLTTYPGWGQPAGLEPRRTNDPIVVLFRRAVGINYNEDCGGSQPTAHERANTNGAVSPSALEQGCQAEPGSIYQQTVSGARSKSLMYNAFNNVANGCHVAQILVGAALTALGPMAGRHSTAITRLGAINTVIAGMFALFKAQGLPGRLHRSAVEYRRLQEWIEETDALIVGGVVGRDREEVGKLVETTFKKFNAVLSVEESSNPEGYVRAPEPDEGVPVASGSGQNGSAAKGSANGNAKGNANTNANANGNAAVDH